jgi:4-nitrophenyl phosphatase
MLDLNDVHAFIIDMDGVLWHGEKPLPGLLEFFAALRGRRLPFVLATNNAASTPDQYVAKLARMGVAVAREEVLTSALATASYLAERAVPAATRVFAIGEDGVRQALSEQGFILRGLYEIDAHYVVCGMDHGISWDKLATATLNIRAGAQFIGTNPDTSLPTERGVTHGNGAILAAIQAGSGAAPTTIGKPAPIMYQQAMARLRVDPKHTVAIGDRLETDILGAVRAGIRSAMVLTGISTREEVEREGYGPTWIVPGLPDITQALAAAARVAAQ